MNPSSIGAHLQGPCESWVTVFRVSLVSPVTHLAGRGGAARRPYFRLDRLVSLARLCLPSTGPGRLVPSYLVPSLAVSASRALGRPRRKSNLSVLLSLSLLLMLLPPTLPLRAEAASAAPDAGANVEPSESGRAWQPARLICRPTDCGRDCAIAQQADCVGPAEQKATRPSQRHDLCVPCSPEGRSPVALRAFKLGLVGVPSREVEPEESRESGWRPHPTGFNSSSSLIGHISSSCSSSWSLLLLFN